MRATMRQLGPAIRCAAALTALIFAASSPARAQEKAGGDGIKVHGHWTIDVKNPDGSLASHNEFENALGATGAASLSKLLASSSVSTFGWVVSLVGPDLTITTPAVKAAIPAVRFDSTDLTVTPSAFPPQLVLSGSVQALSAKSITSVNTILYISENGTFDGSGFSGRVLAQTIDVLGGQIVQVTVAFTFS